MVQRSGRADWDWILQVTFMCRGGGAGQRKGHGDGSRELLLSLVGKPGKGNAVVEMRLKHL